jgi:hypothetical protein
MKKKGNRKRLTKLTAMVTLLAMTVSMLAGCSKFMPKSKTPAVPEQTWAEEQGLLYTSFREFSREGFVFYCNRGEEDMLKEFYPPAAEMKYKFTSAEVSAPDQYGIVTYTVKYNYDCHVIASVEEYKKANEKGFEDLNCQEYLFNVVDGQSGIVPEQEAAKKGQRPMKITEIEWGGRKYTIGWSLAHENNWGEWTIVEKDGVEYHDCTVSRPVTMTLWIPEGYEDVYLFLGKADDTEHVEGRYDQVPSHPFAEKEGNVADYEFIRLTDLVAEFSGQ